MAHAARAPLFRRWLTLLLLSGLVALPALTGCPGPSEDTTDETTVPGDDDTTAPGDDDTTAPGDDDTTAPGDDDTTAPGDDDDTTPGGDEEQCRVLAPVTGGTCEVKAGNATRLIEGDILAPDRILRGGQVVVDASGKITCTACDCSAKAEGATRITCPNGVISPGLINTHDHITFAQNDPYNDTGERYEQRHDWRKGKRGHTKISASGGASNEQILWGELRFLLGGATSTVSSGSAKGFLRNLDTSSQEGLNQPAVNFDTFPLGDSDGTQLSSGCDYPDIQSAAGIEGEDAYFPHVSEGIDDVAHNEFMCLSSFADGGEDLTQPQSAFIHSISLQAVDYALMAARGTALIWSPRSNVTLYGDTALVLEATRQGALVALGTDWMPTGSMNMLRELQCADELNSKYYDKFYSDRELWRMATWYAAQASAVDEVLGALQAGMVADITIFDGARRDGYRAVLEASPTDVVMVMRGGKVLYGDANLVSATNTGTCDTLDVCSRSKRLCAKDDVGETYAQLEAATSGLYPAFFCGVPDNEPTCTPQRTQSSASVNGSNLYTGIPTASDKDGDGIEDTKDNCPRVFNPIRPMDGGKQVDFDLDGMGDVCDKCPLQAGDSDCAVYDPEDVDGDGKPNTADNCPNAPNADQADEDGDGHGDICDACPQAANPGAAACPSNIYDIKSGKVPTGQSVALTNVLVTGRNDSGFFLQVHEGDEGYQGSDYSGIYVYLPGNTVVAGDRLNVTSAAVGNFYGQIQLSKAVLEPVSSGNPLPQPVMVEDPATVATGGEKATALEAVVVQVKQVTVTAVNPTPGAGDKDPNNEVVVNGVLRINDYLYLITPFPVVGEFFASITGILELRNGDSKVEPRGAEDIVAGEPTLIELGPEGMFARVDEAAGPGPTVPMPVVVSLTRAVEEEVFIPVTSSDDLALSVLDGGVTIGAGESSAEVWVEALEAADAVTLTATLGDVSLEVDVTVLAADAVPTLLAIDPVDALVYTEQSQRFTVTLDIPAPVGGISVGLVLDPAELGTMPVEVVVPENALSASVELVAGKDPGEGTLTATLGEVSLEAAVTVEALPTFSLVINEVDYDQPGDDVGEFVEIYNPNPVPMPLADHALVLVNGADNKEYSRIDLSKAGAEIPGHGFLVIATKTLTVPSEALVIRFAGDKDNVQNGSPDGLALVDTKADVLVDALSYEGSMTSVTITGFAAKVSLVEGTAAAVEDSNTAAGSLVRSPDGQDSNDASKDWKLTTKATPGAANQL